MEWRNKTVFENEEIIEYQYWDSDDEEEKLLRKNDLFGSGLLVSKNPNTVNRTEVKANQNPLLETKSNMTDANWNLN